jgi:CubicO group peptidase (beta-lactamase class C family)
MTQPHRNPAATQSQRLLLSRQADNVLNQAVSHGRIPGAAAAVTDASETLYEGAFGLRAQGQPAPMTLDTVMWIASMTKPLVGTAAMQLVEQGKLKLDEPIGRILPEIDAIQVITGWDVQGQPMVRPPNTPITLRHLMTHTAGFTSDIWSENSSRFLKLHKLPRAGSGQRNALNIPLSFDPGERWEYGINITGLALRSRQSPACVWANTSRKISLRPWVCIVPASRSPPRCAHAWPKSICATPTINP